MAVARVGVSAYGCTRIALDGHITDPEYADASQNGCSVPHDFLTFVSHDENNA